MIDCSNLFDIARNIYALPSYNSKWGKALMPLRYFFELTYNCNLRCPYCYVGEDRKKVELSKDDWFSVIKQIPFYSIVTLVGGEPLIRPDFIDIYENVSKKVLSKIHVVSNGILLNDEIIESFVKNNLMLLSVSLDGYGENHNKNRNCDGIFDKIIENLENFNAKKKRTLIDIKTIVLENNLDDLPKLYKLCNKMKFDFLSISFLRNNNLKQNSKLFNEFVPQFNENYPIKKYFDMEHFKEVYAEIESLSKNSKVKVRFSPKFEKNINPITKIEEFFNTNPEKSVKDIYKPCKFPYSNVFITPDGNLYPCLSMNMGNVKEDSIKAIMNKPKCCCFRKNLKASDVFGACQMCCELELK